MSETDAIVAVRDLVFDYPGRRALRGLDFSIRPGTVTALVGPNGAGKTTLMRTLAGLALPYAGSVCVAGIDMLDAPRAGQRRLGFLQDFFGLYDELTVRQCLAHHAAAQGLPQTDRAARIDEVAGLLNLTRLLERKSRALSRGQRQRLAIGQAIIHRPQVLLLDEPAAGLDPEARADLSGLLLRMRDQGITLVVSSHILAELEDYSTDMMILRDGRILDHAPLSSFAAHPEAAHRYRLDLASPGDGLAAFLAARPSLSGIEAEARHAEFDLSGGPEAAHALLKALLDAGFAVASFAPLPVSMQDRYLARLEPGGGAAS